MAKHRLGFNLNPFAKPMARRRVSSLLSKLDKAKNQFCDLSKRVEDEKVNAGNLFTKSEFDKLIGPLEIRLDHTCKCSEKASSKTVEVEGEEEGAGERECAYEIIRELKKRLPSISDKLTKKQEKEILPGLQKGTRTDKQNKAVRDCQSGKEPDYADLIREIKELAKVEDVDLGRHQHNRRR